MLSTKYLYEISDINKSRLGVAGRAALVGGAGFAAYHALKGNDVEKPEKPEQDGPSTTSKVVDGVKKSVKNFGKNIKHAIDSPKGPMKTLDRKLTDWTTSPSKTAGGSQGFGSVPGSTATGPNKSMKDHVKDFFTHTKQSYTEQ